MHSERLFYVFHITSIRGSSRNHSNDLFMEEMIMTSREKSLCNGIIHSASVAAAAVGGGLAQVPTSDNLIIIPIQLTMAVSLGKVFGITLDQSAAKAAVASAAAATVGRTASQVLIGWIPGVGNIINATTAVTITEAIGWIMAKEFESQSAYA